MCHGNLTTLCLKLYVKTQQPYTSYRKVIILLQLLYQIVLKR